MMIYYHFLQFTPYFTAIVLLTLAAGAALKYKKRREKSMLLLSVSAIAMLSLTAIKTYYLTSPFAEDANLTLVLDIEMIGSWLLLLIFAACGILLLKESKSQPGASHNGGKPPRES